GGGGGGQEKGKQKSGGEGVEGDSQVSAQHVLDAVREVDEVHHPEYERKTRRDQEKQDAKLEPVQNLDDEEARGHCTFCYFIGQSLACGSAKFVKTFLSISVWNLPSARLATLTR